MSGTVQSVTRAASMLQLLAIEEEPLGLGQIAAALDLPKATARGLLKTLIEVGFVGQAAEDGRYHLTGELLQLGATQPDINELRAQALDWTDVLAARTGQAAGVAVFRAGQVVRAHHVVAKSDGDGDDANNLAEAMRRPLPLHATALGKVLLAYDPGAGRAVASSEFGLVEYTRRTVTDRVVLHRQLAVLRERGWSEAVDEFRPGRAGLAAPIRDRGGYVVAAVGIEGPTAALCDMLAKPRDEFVHEVCHAAHAISRELGHGR